MHIQYIKFKSKEKKDLKTKLKRTNVIRFTLFEM